MLGELVVIHFVFFGQTLEHAFNVVICDFDAEFLCFLHLETLVNQLFLGVLLQPRQNTRAGTIDSLLLQTRGQCLLTFLEYGDELLA